MCGWKGTEGGEAQLWQIPKCSLLVVLYLLQYARDPGFLRHSRESFPIADHRISSLVGKIDEPD